MNTCVASKFKNCNPCYVTTVFMRFKSCTNLYFSYITNKFIIPQPCDVIKSKIPHKKPQTAYSNDEERSAGFEDPNTASP